MPLIIIPRGPDAGISLHAVDQCSDSPDSEAVKCHIKFSQQKKSNVATLQNSLTTCYNYCCRY